LRVASGFGNWGKGGGQKGRKGRKHWKWGVQVAGIKVREARKQNKEPTRKMPKQPFSCAVRAGITFCSKIAEAEAAVSGQG
jgi:hypothetical protein